MKIATIQTDIHFGNPEANYANMRELILKALGQQPDLVVLPEMWNVAYDLEHLEQHADEDGERTIAFLREMAQHGRVTIHGGSVAVRRGSNYYNTSYTVDPSGEVNHVYDKMHLFQLMNEHHFLSPGTVAETFLIGDTCFAAMTCYDLRFPELARHYALKGAHVLLVPAQWPTARLDHWRILLQARAIENQMYVVAVNRVGQDPNNEFPGHSMIIDPWGTILYEGNDREEVVVTEVDLENVEDFRKKVPVFEDRLPTRYKLD